MKKIFLLIPTILLFIQTSQAEISTAAPVSSEHRCYPYPIPLPKPSFQTGDLVKPSDVQKMLRMIYERHEDRRMQEILGEPALKSLEEYSRMNDRQIYANAYVAAAAAGAAVAVVEYVWDRYVGNGPKNKLVPDEKYFDMNPSVIPSNPRPIRIAQGMIPPHGNIDPVALTPAVGAAAVGAVAYKAVEYSMKKAFGEMQAPPTIRPDSFDLNNIHNEQLR